MALEKNRDVSSRDSKTSGNDTIKGRVKRDKSFQTKVVIRRLPPTMTEEQFLEQISPVPDHDYMYFVNADARLNQYAFSRAYINFTVPEDIFLFKEKFDGYVFLDTKGNEYPAVVEFAPFQKIPKKRGKKKDAKCGTILQDPDYLKFLETLKNPDDVILPTAEAYLEEIENREKELKSNNGVPKITTPLIEYLKQRKIEQQLREEKREERKRKELEKKRIREEEKRRRKAEKDRVKEKLRDKEIQSEKETLEEIEESPAAEDSKHAETVVQVLKNPEREKEQRTHVALQKSKEFTLTRSLNKERFRADWAKERDKQRERNRAKERQRVGDRPFVTHDKDRSRRDRMEHRSHQEENSKEKDTSGKKMQCSEDKKENVSHSPDKKSKAVADCKSDAQHVESLGKWCNKSKRDNSCPGNVESLGSRCETKDSDGDKALTGTSKSSMHEESAEVSENSKSDGGYGDNREQNKDPRVERRIRNKDRPSLEIYRPGMRRFSTQRNSPQKEISTSASNSSTPSPSPTPPLVAPKSQSKEIDKNKNQKSETAGSDHSRDDT